MSFAYRVAFHALAILAVPLLSIGGLLGYWAEICAGKSASPGANATAHQSRSTFM